MSWYDTFSGFYDHSVERVYRPYRGPAVSALGLSPGSSVLDLACGTGPNLEFLADAVGPTGRVVGADFSEGMIGRARRRAERAGWSQVSLIQADARALTRTDLEGSGVPGGDLDGVIVTLGLSVIPDWETVLTHTFGLLKPGGRYVIFDIHAGPGERVPASWWVERIAQAELARKPWEVLDRLSDSVELRRLPGSPHVHGGRPFMAIATKPTGKN